MRGLNEFIARRANAEDDCKGRFWEGRFKSQALLDTSAVLACMTYVDLNPVRAGIAPDLENSAFTSIQERLRAVAKSKGGGTGAHILASPMMPLLRSTGREESPLSLPISSADYIKLVDWTGRQIRNDKRGAIASDMPEVLPRVRMTPKQWLSLSLDLQKRSIQVIGALDRMRQFNKSQGKCWTSGQNQVAAAYT
jgi:putative transposase